MANRSEASSSTNGDSHVQEIRCDEEEGEGDGEEEARPGQGADPQGQGAREGRAVAPHAGAEARGEALQGRPEELVKTEFGVRVVIPRFGITTLTPNSTAYLLVPDLPPIEPPVLGAGAAGDVVLGVLPVELDDEPDEPLVPPLLELDLLKWASHSVREIWPSLLVSTDEKLGWVALGLAALGEAAPVALEESAAMASDESANSAAAVVTVTLFII